MRKPNTPLPWVVNLNESSEEYGIAIGNKTTEVTALLIPNQNEDAVLEVPYILEACNNYPKAIELLKRVCDMDDMAYGEAIKLDHEILNFLKEIEA